MKIFKQNNITLSCDVRYKYNADEEYNKELIETTGLFLSMLYKNNISANMPAFSPEAREAAVAIALTLV